MCIHLALKKQLEDEDGRFVIRESVYAECLELWTYASFREEVEKLQERLNPYRREDRDLLRFHYHRPTELLRQLEDLQREPVRFSVAEEYAPQPQRFISLDEIDKLLRGPDAERGTEDRLAVYAFFLAHPDAKEREKALRNMHGVSGSYGGNDNISYDPKGVSFSHGDMTKPFDAFVVKDGQFVKWSE